MREASRAMVAHPDGDWEDHVGGPPSPDPADASPFQAFRPPLGRNSARLTGALGRSLGEPASHADEHQSRPDAQRLARRSEAPNQGPRGRLGPRLVQPLSGQAFQLVRIHDRLLRALFAHRVFEAVAGPIPWPALPNSTTVIGYYDINFGFVNEKI